jgi:hypothetical protein
MGQILSIMQLPAQSGKTRKSTELMNRWNKIFEAFGNNCKQVNIALTNNNQILAKQFAKRIANDTWSDELSEITTEDDEEASDTMNGIEQDSIRVLKTITWMSKKKGDITYTYDSIFREIILGNIDNIIGCTNTVRIRYFIKLFDDLNTLFKRGLFNRTVNIWIDEADMSLNIWKKHIEKIQGFGGLINNCVLISASMTPVFKYLIKNDIQCNLRVYDQTYGPDYIRFSDCYVSNKYSENIQSQIEHINAVWDNVGLHPGTIWFTPGNISKESHDIICNNAIERGANVLILNGDNKKLVFFDKKTVQSIMDEITDDIELSDAIRNLYQDFSLYDRPFVVTGNLCIGRGITFASKDQRSEFMFTHGIIPNGSAGTVYQQCARMIGNIRQFELFKNSRPCIFMSAVTQSKIAQQEHLATELAKRYNEGTETSVITEERLRAVSTECPIKRQRNQKPIIPDQEFERGGYDKPFKTQDENEEYAKQYGAKKKASYDVNEKGFKMCSCPTLGVHSLADIVRFATEEKENYCSNLDKARKNVKVGEYAYRRYVCYENINDITTERYITIWAKRKIEAPVK